MNTEIDIVQHIRNIVQKSHTAQVSYEKYNQKQVDEVVTAVAWAICNPTNNRKIAELSVETTKLGNIEDKIIKNKRKTLGLLRDLKNKKGSPDGAIEYISQGFGSELQSLSTGSRRFRPVAGHLYIFPSWLLHTVYPFVGKGERRSLSFNSSFKVINKSNS